MQINLKEAKNYKMNFIKIIGLTIFILSFFLQNNLLDVQAAVSTNNCCITPRGCFQDETYCDGFGDYTTQTGIGLSTQNCNELLECDAGCIRRSQHD